MLRRFAFLLLLASFTDARSPAALAGPPEGEEQAGPSAGKEAVWIEDLEQGLAKAREEGRAVLVLFTGSDWCKPCQMLEKNVLSTEEFAAFAAPRFVLVKLDFPMRKKLPEEQKKRNEKWLQRYGIKGFPTLLVLDANGEEKGRSVGFNPDADVSDVLEKLDGFLSERGASQPEVEWLTDFEEAKRRAAKEGKPILADFTGSDWCGWCKKLKREVFDTESFRRWAAENVILLEVDFPRRKEQPDEIREQNAKLLDRYGVDGFPTILFLDAEGRKLGELGYMKGGPSAWIGAAEHILMRARAKQGEEKKEG